MIAQWRLNMQEEVITAEFKSTKTIIVDRLSHGELGAEVGALREENAQLNDLATAAQTEQAEARSALLIMLFNYFDPNRTGKVDAIQLDLLVGAPKITELASYLGGEPSSPSSPRGWTDDSTKELLSNLKRDSDDKVSCGEFVDVFLDRFSNLEFPAFTWHIANFGFAASWGANQDYEQELHQATKAQSEQERARNMLLVMLFNNFDPKVTGKIDVARLWPLLSAPKIRELEQAASPDGWTEDSTKDLLSNLKGDSDGKVSCNEFVDLISGQFEKIEFPAFTWLIANFGFAASWGANQDYEAAKKNVGDELTEVDQVLRAVQLEHATCSGALDESNAKLMDVQSQLKELEAEAEEAAAKAANDQQRARDTLAETQKEFTQMEKR